MKTKHLKKTSEWGQDNLIKVTEIGGLSVCSDSVHHLRINDADDYDNFLDSIFNEGYIEVSKGMFDQFFIKTTKYTNEISKL